MACATSYLKRRGPMRWLGTGGSHPGCHGLPGHRVSDDELTLEHHHEEGTRPQRHGVDPARTPHVVETHQEPDCAPSASTLGCCRTHAPSAGGSWLSSQLVSSRGDDRMGQTTAGKPEARGNLLQLQIGELVHDLGSAQAGRQQVEDIRDTDSQFADAGASSALRGIDRDARTSAGPRLRIPPVRRHSRRGHLTQCVTPHAGAAGVPAFERPFTFWSGP